MRLGAKICYMIRGNEVFEVKRSVQVGKALQSLNQGETSSCSLCCKYRQAKYEIAIDHTEIAVKLP